MGSEYGRNWRFKVLIEQHGVTLAELEERVAHGERYCKICKSWLSLSIFRSGQFVCKPCRNQKEKAIRAQQRKIAIANGTFNKKPGGLSPRVLKYCEYCQAEIQTRPCERDQKFCTWECFQASRRDKSATPNPNPLRSIDRAAATARRLETKKRMKLKLPATERHCSRCAETKKITEFYLKKSGQYTAFCKPCWQAETSAYAKRRRATGWRQKTNKEYERKRTLRRFYGLSVEQYDDLLTHQKGLCAICKNPPKKDSFLYVDHDHKTDLIRGLLCTRCNSGLGHFADSVNSLELAVSYLQLAPIRRVIE